MCSLLSSHIRQSSAGIFATDEISFSRTISSKSIIKGNEQGKARNIYTAANAYQKRNEMNITCKRLNLSATFRVPTYDSNFR